MKQRRELQSGTKIEYVDSLGDRVVTEVIKQRNQTLDVTHRNIPHGGVSIHRRQVTKVWRKKPKPEPEQKRVARYR